MRDVCILWLSTCLYMNGILSLIYLFVILEATLGSVPGNLASTSFRLLCVNEPCSSQGSAAVALLAGHVLDGGLLNAGLIKSVLAQEMSAPARRR